MAEIISIHNRGEYVRRVSQGAAAQAMVSFGFSFGKDKESDARIEAEYGARMQAAVETAVTRAQRAAEKRYRKHIGATSKYTPHQGAAECARRRTR